MKAKIFLKKILDSIKTFFINIYKYLMKDNKTLKDKIILTSICVLLLIVLVVIIITNTNSNDTYQVIKDSINNLSNENEYKKIDTIDIYDYNNANDLTNKLQLTSNTIKKNNNYNLELISNENNDTYSMSHIFISNERIEAILGDESYYVKYKDAFSVASNYLPSLKELASDLERLSYNKYLSDIERSISDILKTKNNVIKNIIKTYLDNASIDDELTKTFINGKEYNLKRYFIKVNARTFIEDEINILKELKGNKEIKTKVRDLNTSLLDTMKQTKDYSKIRMNIDEFNNFRYTYSSELVDKYDLLLDTLISNKEVLYSLISKDDEIELAMYLTKNNEIKQIYINIPVLIENKIYYIKLTSIIDSEGSVKSKEVVPINNRRVDTNKSTRSELYLIVDKLKLKYNAIVEKYNLNFKN